MPETSPAPSYPVWRVLVIGLLLFIARALVVYAPLLPRIGVFLDDVHRIQVQAVELQKTATGIETKLRALEKKFDFFKQTAEGVGNMDDEELNTDELQMMMTAPLAGEEDVHAWAQTYIANEKARMSAEAAATGRPARKQRRAAVRAAVVQHFGDTSGRAAGPLTWLRILYWVAFILLSL